MLDSKVAKEPGQQDTSLIKVKGDTPDRFWTSVEPYCADITEADLLALQEDTENVSHMTRKGRGQGAMECCRDGWEGLKRMLMGWLGGGGGACAQWPTKKNICTNAALLCVGLQKEEIFQVPQLGKHYSRRWAVEDLQEEQSESVRLGQMANPLALWDQNPEIQDKDSLGMYIMYVHMS